jgi:CheY-like chemotaxis protein
MEVLEWYKPDVVVSDLAMPGEDGYSLITRIRAAENGKQTPAVALTSYVRIEDRTRALSAGFNMFVPKPVEPNELITAIANLAELSD